MMFGPIRGPVRKLLEDLYRLDVARTELDISAVDTNEPIKTKQIRLELIGVGLKFIDQSIERRMNELIIELAKGWRSNDKQGNPTPITSNISSGGIDFESLGSIPSTGIRTNE